MNDLKRALRIADLRAGGYDGLVSLDEPCGCGLQDMWPCGDGPYPSCMSAKAVVLDEYQAQFCDLAMPGDTVYVEPRFLREWK